MVKWKPQWRALDLTFYKMIVLIMVKGFSGFRLDDWYRLIRVGYEDSKFKGI